ncbi:hypothetical protein A7X61_13830 [Stenotrophomonas maltophilia]|nr:hypothetical protein A7X61_13830 [Stenotrophomonas maltophilia]PZS78791.1 hypothetical protein A7X74_13430 [Stenotrophomonas maltophilia]
MGGLEILPQLVLKGPVVFGCLAYLRLKILHLLACSIYIAQRPILDRSDVLGPILSLRFRRFQRFVKPGVKMLCCCLSSIGSSKPEIALLREL